MMKLSDNMKLLPNIDIYLIHKYHNIKNDITFIKTYDIIIEVLNYKNLEEIENIIDFNDLIKLLKYKKNLEKIYELFLDYKKIKGLDKENIIEKPKKIIKIIKDDVKEIKYKKKRISATLKRLVWNYWIGEEIGKSKCLCCKITDITAFSFNCGHIIAESKGGETILKNLKPICQNCNSSMASMNMNDFMKTFQ